MTIIKALQSLQKGNKEFTNNNFAEAVTSYTEAITEFKDAGITRDSPPEQVQNFTAAHQNLIASLIKVERFQDADNAINDAMASLPAHDFTTQRAILEHNWGVRLYEEGSQALNAGRYVSAIRLFEDSKNHATTDEIESSIQDQMTYARLKVAEKKFSEGKYVEANNFLTKTPAVQLSDVISDLWAQYHEHTSKNFSLKALLCIRFNNPEDADLKMHLHDTVATTDPDLAMRLLGDESVIVEDFA